ncbi:MAG: hypothetical protein OFPI_43260 [Osedax symbiont Rs2]|nr:MAG: hypothetical protein OFPI_43260 [Osedax symbiont Rs2]
MFGWTLHVLSHLLFLMDISATFYKCLVPESIALKLLLVQFFTVH